MKILHLLAATALVAVTAYAAPSTWVFYGTDGHLHYQTWGNGNKIMDFSTAGYMGGGVALPDVATVQTLSPSGGDDKTAIQNAINAVAAKPLVNGFRGALQLSAGTFKVSGQLNVTASGVVVRGAGSGSGGTVIVMNNSSSFTLFNVGGSGSLSTSGKVNITDSYVPSGTNGFNVSDASSFNVGDTVSVGRTVTDAWLHLIGMDSLVRNGSPQTWISAGTVIRTDRRIQAISGNHITLDAPLTDSFDQTYLGSPVGSLSHYTFSSRVSQIGLEHFKIQAPAVASGYTAIDMDVLIDSWARDIAIVDGVNNVNVGGAGKRITLDSISISHTVDQTSSAAPCDYAFTGTQVLLNKCKSSGHGSWAYVTRSKGTGPIVILNCSSTQDRGVAPHERWTTGILTDSSQFPNAQSSGSKEGFAYSNRGTDGSGQGWDAGWSVGWNVTSPFVLSDAAPGTESWSIGSGGAKGSSSDPHGIYESLGTKVDLGATDSLYLEQLRERLGDQALVNIGYGSASPDFSLSASPTSVSVTQGQNGTSTITETDLNGYTGTVTLSASGLPAGVTASFNPTSTTNNSALTLTASSTATTGTATVTITGTDGTHTHTTTVTLTVNAAPDFSISASPASQTVIEGNSANYTVTVGSINGFVSPVDLAISGLPAGASAAFNPTPVTPAGTSTLTVSTAIGTAAGTYTLTITGTSGSLTHSTTVSLTVVPPPDFSLAASPNSVTITQGTGGNSTISVTGINGFAGSVSLSASGLPAGVTASFNPSSTTTSSTLTLNAGSTATTGTATVTITGTSGSLTHTTTVSLTVNPSSGGALPVGWTDVDIGAVGVTGSASYNAGTFTINGSGSDIFGTGDQFHYAYQSVSGDTTVIARVVSESQTASFPKAGVMIRESLATNAIEACVVVTPTNGVAMEVRSTTGATTINMTGWIKGPLPPQWVKLVRVGSTFTGSYSADGSTWTQIAATNITMAAGSTAGLAVTAHNIAALNTATIDNVSLINNSFAGIFKIQNVASGLVLNNQGSLTNGSKITQWTATTVSTNLDWTFIPTTNGYYQVRSLKSGKDAAVQSASTAAGAGIIQWDFGTAGNDQWKPVSNGDGSYTLFNLHSGMVLGDPGASTSTATQMDQETSNGGSNQKWKLLLQ